MWVSLILNSWDNSLTRSPLANDIGFSIGIRLALLLKRGLDLLLQQSLLLHLSRVSYISTFFARVIRVFNSNVCISVGQKFVQALVKVILSLLQDSLTLGSCESHIHQSGNHGWVSANSCRLTVVERNLHSVTSKQVLRTHAR